MLAKAKKDEEKESGRESDPIKEKWKSLIEKNESITFAQAEALLKQEKEAAKKAEILEKEMEKAKSEPILTCPEPVVEVEEVEKEAVCEEQIPKSVNNLFIPDLNIGKAILRRKI